MRPFPLRVPWRGCWGTLRAPTLLLPRLLPTGQQQICQDTQAKLGVLAAQGAVAVPQLPRPLVMRLGGVRCGCVLASSSNADEHSLEALQDLPHSDRHCAADNMSSCS